MTRGNKIPMAFSGIITQVIGSGNGSDAIWGIIDLFGIWNEVDMRFERSKGFPSPITNTVGRNPYIDIRIICAIVDK